MRVVFFLMIASVGGLLSCQQDAEEVQVTPKAATTDPKQTSQESREEKDSEPSNDFYEMTGEKPPQLCGEEGFAYLWEGYLLNECGTCHHADNPYGVTEFAIRGNFDSSFQAMINTVDRQEFLKAVQENPLCMSCNLDQSDPLLSDIKQYVQSPRSCQ